MDWLKIRIELRSDPRVLEIAAELGVKRNEVVGAFLALWGAASTFSVDGTLPRATPRSVDLLVELPGFSEAAVKVDWLRFNDAPGGGAVIPRWGEHNSDTARKRAEHAAQTARNRAQKSNESRTPVGEQRTKKGDASDDARTPVRETSHSERTGRAHSGRQEQEQEQEQEKKTGGASAPPAASRREAATDSARRRGGLGASGARIGWAKDTFWVGITDADRERWAKAYPAVDIDRQLSAMTEWLLANPVKARKSNWLKFVVNWLSRKQDEGGDVPSNRRRDGPAGAPGGGGGAGGEPAWKREKREAKSRVREALGG